MFELKTQSGTRRNASNISRGLRAAVSKPHADANSRKKDGGFLRARRGASTVVATPWRRYVAGPNRISSLGVWKRGARREAIRANRAGDTQWIRPYRPQAGAGVAVWDDTFQNESA